MKQSVLASVLGLLLTCRILAQDGQTNWDNTVSKNWPRDFITVQIKSTVDGKMQKAIFYKSRQKKPQPLILSLHTWSGDYLQEDPLVKEVILRDWNYIHPDFRGPNNTPEACGSPLVVTDIDDAIQFAIGNSNVDTNEVHVIGASGGGYATLLAFMKLRYPVKSFSAWVGISDIEEWYLECKGRQLKYARDLEWVTTSGIGFNATDARKRSPRFMQYQPELREVATVRIYPGIHDGYIGSVPITQSVNMFNKLLMAMYPHEFSLLVPDSLKVALLEKRIDHPASLGKLGGRDIHLQRWLPNLSLTVFEGGHEMLAPQALSLLQPGPLKNMQALNILTVGDSNGAVEYGWPAQLRKLLPFSTIVNKSVAGNTIGFDNLSQEKLNTLKNIDRYLDEAYSELGVDQIFDYVFIGLGTNDAKQVFEPRKKEVPRNMDLLIQKIRHWTNTHQKGVPVICLVSSPPIDSLNANTEKYGGGDKRVQQNNEQFKRVAKVNHIDFLDIYSNLKADFQEKTSDGVHLNEVAQFQLASEIKIYLDKKIK